MGKGGGFFSKKPPSTDAVLKASIERVEGVEAYVQSFQSKVSVLLEQLEAVHTSYREIAEDVVRFYNKDPNTEKEVAVFQSAVNTLGVEIPSRMLPHLKKMVVSGCDDWLAKLAASKTKEKEEETWDTRYKFDHYDEKVAKMKAEKVKRQEAGKIESKKQVEALERNEEKLAEATRSMEEKRDTVVKDMDDLCTHQLDEFNKHFLRTVQFQVAYYKQAHNACEPMREGVEKKLDALVKDPPFRKSVKGMLAEEQGFDGGFENKPDEPVDTGGSPFENPEESRPSADNEDAGERSDDSSDHKEAAPPPRRMGAAKSSSKEKSSRAKAKDSRRSSTETSAFDPRAAPEAEFNPRAAPQADFNAFPPPSSDRSAAKKDNPFGSPAPAAASQNPFGAASKDPFGGQDMFAASNASSAFPPSPAFGSPASNASADPFGSPQPSPAPVLSPTPAAPFGAPQAAAPAAFASDPFAPGASSTQPMQPMGTAGLDLFPAGQPVAQQPTQPQPKSKLAQPSDFDDFFS